MRRNFIKTLGSVCLLLINAFSAHAQNWATLDRPLFSVDYPTHWDLNEEGAMGTAFILFSKLEENDEFRENINLMIQDLSAYNFTLDSYTELSENQISVMIENATILQSERLKSVNGEHHLIEYTGVQNNLHLYWKQYYWVVDKKAYLLTFTAEQEQYERYLVTANQIINSFTLRLND